MAGKEFSTGVRVYIEDTDAGGIVYYVNYLKFMERARTEFMRSLGFDKDYIFNHELIFVVRDISVQYLQSARLDDELRATVVLTKLGGASMVMKQSVCRGEECLARGLVTIACVAPGAMRPQRLPRDMADRLRHSLDQ